MRVTVRRAAGSLVGLVCVAVALSTLANRLLWGYWWTPPTVATAFSKAQRLRAIGLWEVRQGQPLRAVLQGQSALQAERWKELPLWGWHGLMRLRDAAAHVGDAGVMNSLTPGDLAAVWASLRGETPWFVTAPPYSDSASSGWLLVAEVSSDGRRTFVVGYQTSEIADDRYAYEEAVLESGEALRRVQSVHYFFEVSGLEFLSLPVLLVVSSILVLAVTVCVLGMLSFGRRLRRARELRSA